MIALSLLERVFLSAVWGFIASLLAAGAIALSGRYGPDLPWRWLGIGTVATGEVYAFLYGVATVCGALAILLALALDAYYKFESVFGPEGAASIEAQAPTEPCTIAVIRTSPGGRGLSASERRKLAQAVVAWCNEENAKEGNW